MRRRYTWIGAWLIAALALMPARAARAWPPDFELIQAARGVALYRREGEHGPEFVQLVNLSHGASVELRHGHIAHFRPGDDSFDEDHPQIGRYALDRFWYEARAANENAFCVFNGQFFLATQDPTGLAFALRKDGEVITPGYALHAYSGQQQLLRLWDTRADIVSMTLRALYTSSAPHALGGLTENAGSNLDRVTGRTSIGVADLNGDGQHELLLVYTAAAASQPHVGAVLREFGAERIIMLDGGGSTQLICNGQSYIASDRRIPQAIVVRGGGPLPAEYAASVVERPYTVDALPKQPLTLTLTLENTGTRTWAANGPVLVAVQGTGLLTRPSWPLPRAVAPGERMQWTLDVYAPRTPGIYPVAWELRFGDRVISERVEVRVAVRAPETPTRAPDLPPPATATPEETAAGGAGLCSGTVLLAALVWWIGRRAIV